MPEKLEPGYYKDEAGNRRYWDGEAWLVPDAGPKKNLPISPRTVRLLSLGLIVVAVVGLGYWGFQEYTYQQKVQILEAEHLERARQLSAVPMRAVNDCSPSGTGFSPSSRGLIINTVGNENFDGASYLEMICVLEALDIPPGSLERVGATTSLQGLVEASWAAQSGDLQVAAEWSYHPDPGMTMTIDFSSPYFSDFVAPER